MQHAFEIWLQNWGDFVTPLKQSVMQMLHVIENANFTELI
jgi:hypothetical protein